MPRRHALAHLAIAGALALLPRGARAQGRTLCLREEGVDARCPPGSVTPPPAPEGPDTSANIATAALARAREQFLAYSFSEAAATLRMAGVRAAHELVRGHRELAVELELWAGACDFLSSNREGSRAAFERALALQPDAHLPVGIFPPEVEGFFAEVARDRMTRMPTAVTVRSVPPAAALELDGRPAGQTPATLTLAQGVHYLRIERVGYVRWTGVLAVEGTGLITQEIVLQPATGTDLRAQLGRPAGLATLPDASALATIAREMNVTRVHIARRDGSALRFPPETPPPPPPLVWPWIVGGVALAAGLGVASYLVLRPEPELRLLAP